MITDSTMMIDVKCQPLPRGVGHMRLDGKMTDALIVLGRGFQSTPETQALMQDPSSFRVWLTGTELIGRPQQRCACQQQSTCFGARVFQSSHQSRSDSSQFQAGDWNQQVHR